jgi:hypothetical protein
MNDDAAIAAALERMLAPPIDQQPEWERVLRDARMVRIARRGFLVAVSAAAVAISAGTAVAVRLTVFGGSPQMGTRVAASGDLVLRADIGTCGGALYVYERGRFLGSASGMAVRGLHDCEHPPARKHSVGWLYGSTSRDSFLAGVTSPGVARLAVTLATGRRMLSPVLHRAPASMRTRLRYFLGQLDGVRERRFPIAAFTTYDADGHVIEHWRVPRPRLPGRR